MTVLKNVKLDMLEGILPERWFTEKSTNSNSTIVPIFIGILPFKRLYDKFNDCNA